MRTWKDLSLVEQPARIAAMQKDERGYPIPHTVQWANGKPDFRVIDPEKWVDAVTTCRCGICGEKIEGPMAFTGGPISIKNRLFTDLPMHKECAEYALQVCPFLAMPKFGYLDNAGYKMPVKVMQAVSNDRPDRFGLAMTDGFQVARIGHAGGDIVIWANEFTSVEWWVNGERQ